MTKRIKLIQCTPEELGDLIKKCLQTQLEDLKNLSNTKDEKQLIYSKKETAEFLKIDLSTLHRWTKEGKIKAHGIGNRVYYLFSDINNALIKIN